MTKQIRKHERQHSLFFRYVTIGDRENRRRGTKGQIEGIKSFNLSDGPLMLLFFPFMDMGCVAVVDLGGFHDRL